MNLNRLAITCTLALFILTSSCKKESCPAPTYPIEGYWLGKYGNAAAAPTSAMSMIVEASGKVTVADGSTITSSPTGAGTWTLTGNIFKATYTYSGGGTFSIQATWSNDGKLTGGTWGQGANPSGLGTWYMDRKN